MQTCNGMIFTVNDYVDLTARITKTKHAVVVECIIDSTIYCAVLDPRVSSLATAVLGIPPTSRFHLHYNQQCGVWEIFARNEHCFVPINDAQALRTHLQLT